MWNIFIVIFCLALSLAFFNPYFFISYLIGIAFFGLFQAIFMANAGGAWDNAKKIVEVELRQKGTDLHAATVVGDTVGDPFKDTSSVALNPVIKFTTLFGLLAVEIAATMQSQNLKNTIGGVLFVVALVFVHRSFYGMRVPEAKEETLSPPAGQVPGIVDISQSNETGLKLNHGKSNGKSSVVLEEGQSLAARRN
jgi:K(+)-stimulated pyrophosphate-energized sodium pump